MPGHVLVYFAVHDCDETCETAVRLGGRVTSPPFDTPHGRIAVLRDDQGARFAVLAEPKEKPDEDRAGRHAEDRGTGRSGEPGDRSGPGPDGRSGDGRGDRPGREPAGRPAHGPAGETDAERVPDPGYMT
jgi:hypothetical protein